jgi:hypothetical protein
MGFAIPRVVPFRRIAGRILLGIAIAVTSLVSVGLTAPADGVFSIAVHPTLLRLDRAAIEQSRARALGLDIDIKLGSMHMHLGWSALSLFGGSVGDAEGHRNCGDDLVKGE